MPLTAVTRAMVKALDAPYEAGRRGRAGSRSSGHLPSISSCSRRSGGTAAGAGAEANNLHLGARDPETGGFVMLGKTFKGMTDETLA